MSPTPETKSPPPVVLEVLRSAQGHAYGIVAIGGGLVWTITLLTHWRAGIAGFAALVSTVLFLGGIVVVGLIRRAGKVDDTGRAMVIWLAASLVFAQLHVGPQMGVGVFWTLIALVAQSFVGFRTALAVIIAMFGATTLQGWLVAQGGPLPVQALASPLAMTTWLRVSVTTAVGMLAAVVVTRAVLETLRHALQREEDERHARGKAEAARQQAEHAMLAHRHFEMLGQVAGGVAHDVNNALTVVMTMAHFLEHDCTDAERPQILTELRNATLAAGQTTRQLLLMSRRAVSNLTLVDPVDASQQIIRTVKRMFPDNVVLAQLGSTGRRVRVDRFDLQQALLNLLINARDVLPEGGRIELEVADIDLDAGQPAVAFRVRDTGPGVATEMRSRIFEPFFTTKPEGKGTGLGLPMVTRFAESVGGRVVLESESGRGSTFSILVPEGSEPAVRPESMRVIAGHGRRVLLVEDRPEVLDANRRVLESAGFAVDCALNGTEAELAIEQRDRFSLLCIDSVVPGGSSASVISHFVARHHKAPVLICSGDVSSPALESLTAGGQFPVLPKPFSPTEFLHAIARLVDAAR